MPRRREVRERPIPKSLYTIEYQRERRWRVAGWVLKGIGTVMAVIHTITHLGRLRIIGMQDLLIGYPIAAVLILAGLSVVGFAART
ncbi:conserved hypothetical protein [uncultured Mycobacterium sp.]|uniref:Uncharacterized protein n=2 Tax=Mycobacteriaceae TaxID=1762 RepID=A0A064CEF9_9MYCO|nr:hypothetical protein [Mycolicibacterium aromaticivorans]KDE97108.1 hypothetical protein Y900_027865 [Mycolicibacterium aromaticivorans JS19b1 = JCM 16368]SBS79389.1 conserved hypothetical protein [uncultured Mycobacterium sp.]